MFMLMTSTMMLQPNLLTILYFYVLLRQHANVELFQVVNRECYYNNI